MKRSYFRHVISFACMILLSCLLSDNVNAMSLEAYGAGGVGSGNTGGWTQEGANIVFYEGKNIDFFIGAEATSFDDGFYYLSAAPNLLIDPSGNLISHEVNVTTKMNSATIGMRWKMRTSGRWTPYLMAGFVYGKAEYSIDTKSDPWLTYSSTSYSTDLRSFRGGIGTDVALSDQWGLGLEINYTQGPPAFDLTATETGSGETKSISYSPKGLLGVLLRLKYAF